jgi:hypothetical protein
VRRRFGNQHEDHSLEGEAPCLPPEQWECQCEVPKASGKHTSFICASRSNRGVFERRQAIGEEVVGDETAADGAGGGARGSFDVDELLNGGSNGFDVLLRSFPPATCVWRLSHPGRSP